jgi:hypothetical protein
MTAIPYKTTKFCFCHKPMGPGRIYGGNSFLANQVLFLSQTHWARKDLWRQFLPSPPSFVYAQAMRRPCAPKQTILEGYTINYI